MTDLGHEVQVDDAVVVTADDVVVHWSPAAERLFGVPARSAVGQRIGDVLSGMPAGSSVSEASHRMRIRPPRGPTEVLVTRSELPVDGDGNLAVWVARPPDPSAVAQGRLDDQRRLLAYVSHELRNPVAALIGMTQLLERDDLREGVDRELLVSIRRQVRELQMLADDLLVAERLGDLRLRAEPVDVSALVADVVGLFDRRIAVDVPPGLRVRGDRERMVQVIRNLVENAVKYGGDHIRIEARTDRDRVSLVVADDGSGVPAAFEPRLFERLAVADPSQADSIGLGLHVSRELVRSMEGDLLYRRVAGETRFVVDLASA